MHVTIRLINEAGMGISHPDLQCQSDSVTQIGQGTVSSLLQLS